MRWALRNYISVTRHVALDLDVRYWRCVGEGSTRVGHKRNILTHTRSLPLSKGSLSPDGVSMTA